MKRIFSIVVVALFLVILFISTQNSTKTTTSSVTDENLIVLNKDLNFREGPGLSYPITSLGKEGQAFSILDEAGEWFFVTDGKDFEGWIPSWQTTNNGKMQSTKITIARSTIDGLNVRAEPSISSAVLKQLSIKDEVVVIKEDEDWVKVEDSIGTSGWISKNFVSFDEKQSEELINTQKPSETDSSKNQFIISVESVYVREEPNLSSTIIGKVKKDDHFDIIEQNNNWVKIQLAEGEFGWIYRFYGAMDSSNSLTNDLEVTIIYGGTNLRESPSTSSPVVKRAMIGESYDILSADGDWYKIAINGNESAYVAQWVVSSNMKQSTSEDKPVIKRKKGTLNGLTIVLDPGHGGNDQGTAGYRGTIEKDITLITAQLLQTKLQGAGATVYLTRESDMYIDLRKRVSIAHSYSADAFISIHYDATEDKEISGFTTYYYHDFQQKLAQSVNNGIANKVPLRDRGAQNGDYLVLRENYQNAILIELGYLSNPAEERVITTDYYREQATLGIYEGIINYFDAKLQSSRGKIS
ncbi:N-acetylmuramoyl-L-alanine amidase [Ureibacillus manganicus]|uniref:SH3b domain-containing protein n=1 Tax=Ureibacillus manganicus DSM 26584 TaxID=1384049 RepID=A0A0A3HRE7_9BACL|nr:N-acetylmuramoyl-L-alanine amidase [Ureibacillus manganicus]KGR74979.1 hypothetical protein CD29_18355 [Ureibacillus manganicus DSM 26584]